MCKYFDRYTLAGAAAVFLIWLAAVPSSTLAGIIQAIIPAAVPTANKTGNSSKFQLASGSVVAGNCGQFDGSGNLVDAGITCNGVGSGTPGATVFSSTTSAGPNDTAVETSLIGTVTGSTSIAANTFTDGAILEARSQGFFSLPAVADSLTLKAKCGSTVIGSATATLPAGVLTNGTFRFWLTITARGTGAGGSFITNGLAEFSGAALTPSDTKVLNTSTVAFDFTTSCSFDLTATWGAAQVGELITGTNAAAWFPGAPVTSVGGAMGAVKSGFQGNGTLIQLSTGSVTNGNCAKFDANGNVIDAGAACGTGSGGFTLVEQHTASTSASLDFTTCISSTYDDYVIRFVSIIPATGGTNLLMRLSTDGGGTYDSGTNYYSNDFEFTFNASGTDGGGQNQTAFGLGRSVSVAAGTQPGFSGQLNFSNPLDSAHRKNLYGQGVVADTVSDPRVLGWQYAFQYQSTTAVNAFQLLMSSGNIASGTVRCYGLAK